MSVTPDFVGQIYKDTNTGNLWRANSTTPGDWTLELQNFKTKWNPKSISISELCAFFGDTWGGHIPIDGVTDLIFEQATTDYFVYLEGSDSIESISFPNMVTMLGEDALGSTCIYITSAGSLSSFSAPLLTYSESDIDIGGNSTAPITTFSFPSLVTVSGQFSISNCPNVISVSFPNFIPTNGNDIIVQGAALTLAAVNHILSRAVANAAYVSGTINISGGTSVAPPTGAGTDHDILTARGVVIVHN